MLSAKTLNRQTSLSELMEVRERSLMKNPSCSPKRVAWVFPGQGSQSVGMAASLSHLDHALARFKQAEKILGWSVLETCESEEKLSLTQYCQPCLFVVSSIFTDLLQQKGSYPDFLAGYSLGEYMALYAAGVFDFESGLKLLQKRAALMGQAPSGIMVVLMGCNRTDVEEHLHQFPSVRLISDEVNPLIISGSKEDVESALQRINPRRVLLLNAAKAFHTQFMTSAEAAYQSILDATPFCRGRVPILSNLQPIPTTDPDLLKARLRSHMTQTIRWQETILRLAENEVEQIVEIGPNQSLTSNLKRCHSHFILNAITNSNDIASWCSENF